MTEDRPKIADKVMFWQEQDRINQELIPRVLKQHELIASHIQNLDETNNHLALLEARMTSSIDNVRRKAFFVCSLSSGVAIVAVIVALVF